MGVQALRDVPGWGIYFYSYEIFKILAYGIDKIVIGGQDFVKR